MWALPFRVLTVPGMVMVRTYHRHVYTLCVVQGVASAVASAMTARDDTVQGVSVARAAYLVMPPAGMAPEE